MHLFFLSYLNLKVECIGERKEMRAWMTVK